MPSIRLYVLKSYGDVNCRHMFRLRFNPIQLCSIVIEPSIYEQNESMRQYRQQQQNVKQYICKKKVKLAARYEI